MTDAQLAEGKKLDAERKRLHRMMGYFNNCKIVRATFTRKTPNGTCDEVMMELTPEEVHAFYRGLEVMAQKKEKRFVEL